MSLDNRYIAAGVLDEYFVDKDTGLPLAGGYINFYRDNNRSQTKDVFIISGTAPNYTYTNIGKTVDLSGTGTPSYNDNNIVIYYFPYDNDGNLDLYYAEVFSYEDVEQFTREAWPPNVTSIIPSDQNANMTNFVPNGQFLSHNNINNEVLGQIDTSVSSTPIAPGGWYYTVPHGSSTVDNVKFFRYPSYVSNPTASPRFASRIVCSSPDISDGFKYYELRFDDVNKFSSGTQLYTYAFIAQTYLSSNFSCSLILYKNFGTGGSSPVTQFLTNFTITSSTTLFKFSFLFGTNEAYSIGTKDDDYVSIILALPTTIAFGIQSTDFILYEGSIEITSFPAETDADMMSRTMTSPVPDYNGYNYYLPLIQTPKGLIYDDSQVGMVFPLSTDVIPVSYLPCDGLISYLTDGYSSDGIPYKRLQQKLLTVTPTNPGLAELSLPIFGTGPQYVNSYSFIDNDAYMMLVTNKFGAQSLLSDGAIPTNFNFYETKGGKDDGYGFSSYPYFFHGIGPGEAFLWIICNEEGNVTGSIGPGTTSLDINTFPDTTIGERWGTSVTQQIMSLNVNGPITPGTYFYISNPSQQYYVWFTIDGTGSDPMATGIGIQVNLLSIMDGRDIANIIAYALSGFQIISIQITKTGSTLTPNSYFVFYANSQSYYVWYSLNGLGIDPLVGSSIGIEVDYLLSDNIGLIRLKTLQAMNSMYFATPDLRGITIKGWDKDSANDKNIKYRYATNWLINPGYIGTNQFDIILGHIHPVPQLDSGGFLGFQLSIVPSQTIDNGGFQNVIGVSGASQNDVKNMYLNYVMKY